MEENAGTGEALTSTRTALDIPLEPLQAAVEKAVEFHAKLGNPIAIWKDGRLVVEPAPGEAEPR